MGSIFFCLYINCQTTKWGGGGACEWGAIRGSLRSHKYRNILNLCI